MNSMRMHVLLKRRSRGICEIGRVLTDHMSLVVVTSSDEDNAASVFETLNDRGIGLSTPDLLRNLLLRRAPDEPAREGIVNAWQAILSIEDDVSVDQLLRHYWISLHGDVKARALYREMKRTISAESIDSLNFSQDLAKTAYLYRDLVLARVDHPELKDSLDAIRSLKATVLYPALVSAQSVSEDSPDDVAALAKILLSLFVRYNVIGGRETTVLESTVYKVAGQLRKDGNFSAARATLQALAPELREFRRQFARAVIPRRATARYLLRELEHARRATEELIVNTPQNVHVEHIYPQSPAEGQRLQSHAAVLDRLGNLTLLSRRLNTSIRNADFPTKRDAAYRSSDIRLTQDLAKVDPPWDVAAIDTRQQELAHIAVSVWKFPDEPALPPSTERLPNGDGDELSPHQLPEVPPPSGATSLDPVD
jgi:hypothetical protein